MNVKVLIVDDHRLVKESLAGMLARVEGVEVVGQAENGRDALRLVRSLQPDIVIMDVAMPGLNGIEATQRIVQDRPNTKVIGLSMHAERQLVLGMLKAGALAYLLKDCAFEELVQAMETVVTHGTYLPPAIANIVIAEMHKPSCDEEGGFNWAELTTREREILQLLAEGKTSEAIADLLNVSIHTVYAHRRNIMLKTKATNLADLTRFAIREKLTTVSE